MPPTPPPPLPEQPPVVVPDEQPDEPAATPAPELEHARCWACGWLLVTSLAGDLYCLHPRCEQYHVVVGTLVADRAANDRLREAIEMANGEQRDRAQEPPQH